MENSIAQRSRVLLLIPHLGGGGAEQVTALLARGLSREKYDVHLGLITQDGRLPQPFPPGLSVHALGATRVRAGAFPLLWLVRRIRPDLILSGMAHLNFLVLLLRPMFPRGTRVFVRQNGTMSSALAFGGLPGYTRLLYRLLYRHADRVICQTPAMASDLAAQAGVPKARLAVLPNPLDIEAIRSASNKSTGPRMAQNGNNAGPHLLAVGRLSKVKGFDLLLRALVTVRMRFPQAHLTIAGAGPEEAALTALCRALGLEAAVRFAGHVQNPSTCFSGASIFVLSSRHEGLPNALLEAAAGGLPIAATPASDGLADLLRGQPGVWLARAVSSDALASSLLEALETLQPGQRVAHAFIEPFRIERAIGAYESLIDAVLAERAQ